MAKIYKDTFERATVLLAYLANQAAYPIAYNQDANSWVKEPFKHIKEHYELDFWKEVFSLTIEQKLLLGFRMWTNETDLLIPIWIIECLPDNFDAVVESISGKRCSIKEIDKDTRAGCVAYTMVKVK